MKLLLSQIRNQLTQLQAISLDEMNSVALMKRLDSKFVLSLTDLPELLNRIRDQYSLLTIDDETIFDYRTTYYDTEDLETYTDHLRGKSLRHKIRIREYINTNVNYFEIKKKTSSGGTDKVRIKTIVINNNLEDEQIDFIGDHLAKADGKSYRKILANTFNRITLANPKDKERVTLDFNLGFENENKERTFESLCIVEIKQPRINRLTPIFKELKKMGIRPLRISKYCLGVTCLRKVKSNLFKPKMKTLFKTLSQHGNI